MSFTVTTELHDDRQLAVTIVVDPQRVERELRKAAAKVGGQYRIPGFRKGKAPYNIIVQQFGLPNLYNEFVEDLGQELFQEAIKQEGIEPFAQSALEDIQLEPLTYKLLVPLDPEILLGDYRSLRMDDVKPGVDDAEVERRLEAYREQYAGWQDVDRASVYGDMLTIDIKSVIIPAEGDEVDEVDEDDEVDEVDEGDEGDGIDEDDEGDEGDGIDEDDEGDEGDGIDESDEIVVLDEIDWDVTPDLENPMEPPGFDEQLIALAAGDTHEFVLGWPADGQSIYAGKQARFVLTVKTVQAYEKPELNDDLAKLVGPDFETVEDLKKNIRESVEAGEKNRIESEFVTQVLDAVVDMSTLSYPPVVIEDQIDGMLEDTEQRLRQLRIDSLDTFLRQTNQSREEYREHLRPEATKVARRNLVISEIVKSEDIRISDDEVEARIVAMVGGGEDANEAQLESAAALANMLRQGGGRNMIVSQLLTQKAINYLVAIARGEEPELAAESEAVAEIAEGVQVVDVTEVAEAGEAAEVTETGAAE